MQQHFHGNEHVPRKDSSEQTSQLREEVENWKLQQPGWVLSEAMPACKQIMYNVCARIIIIIYIEYYIIIIICCYYYHYYVCMYMYV